MRSNRTSRDIHVLDGAAGSIMSNYVEGILVDTYWSSVKVVYKAKTKIDFLIYLAKSDICQPIC